MRYGPLGSLFGLSQAQKPTSQEHSPALYHEHNDMPEPNMMELEYDDSDENIEEDPMQILHDIEDNIWNSLLLRNLNIC